jgi:hypothetical protein
LGLNADLTDVRTYVYRSLADEAKVVTPADVGAALAVSATEALSALRELHDAHLVVLDSSLSRIAMAHPWAARFGRHRAISWPISSFRSNECGTTWSSRAATNCCSAARTMSTSGLRRRVTPAARFWVSGRSGGWQLVGTKAD